MEIGPRSKCAEPDDGSKAAMRSSPDQKGAGRNSTRLSKVKPTFNRVPVLVPKAGADLEWERSDCAHDGQSFSRKGDGYITASAHVVM